VPVNPTRPLLEQPGVADAAQRSAPTPADAEEFGRELSRAQAADVVTAQRTRLSGEQAANAISQAWQERFGEPPSQGTLSILVAHWAHETGRGESMLNYNFGGIKGSSPGGLSAAYKTREGFGENEQRIVARFRAYESATEGARDYVDLLARRYGDAVDNASREDAPGFVRALKAKGYFTGEEQAYVKSVSSLAAQAQARGFDAIGASGMTGVAGPSGAVASSATNDATRDGALPIEAAAAAAPRIVAPLGNEALLTRELASVAQSWSDTPASSTPESWNALSFADEVSRAALLIAARYGRSEPEERG
jgi:mannosyl-glycoprotein endo-beta-N-acetylglucosaminidase